MPRYTYAASELLVDMPSRDDTRSITETIGGIIISYFPFKRPTNCNPSLENRLLFAIPKSMLGRSRIEDNDKHYRPG